MYQPQLDMDMFSILNRRDVPFPEIAHQFWNNQTLPELNYSPKKLIRPPSELRRKNERILKAVRPKCPYPESDVYKKILNLVLDISPEIQIHKELNVFMYVIKRDKIVLPKLSKTRITHENWHLVILHEIFHWTGASNRLNRNFGDYRNKSGNAYENEEISAELTALYLAKSLGWKDPLPEGRYDDPNHPLPKICVNQKILMNCLVDMLKATDYIINIAKGS